VAAAVRDANWQLATIIVLSLLSTALNLILFVLMASLMSAAAQREGFRHDSDAAPATLDWDHCEMQRSWKSKN